MSKLQENTAKLMQMEGRAGIRTRAESHREPCIQHADTLRFPTLTVVDGRAHVVDVGHEDPLLALVDELLQDA